jgi:hypothetical protein
VSGVRGQKRGLIHTQLGDLGQPGRVVNQRRAVLHNSGHDRLPANAVLGGDAGNRLAVLTYPARLATRARSLIEARARIAWLLPVQVCLAHPGSLHHRHTRSVSFVTDAKGPLVHTTCPGGAR